ncbi:MAG: Uma2 family endonuclease [Planctomycetota bacterium]|nr:Uma2 family endonuclease [Planctomycetota bacterium]
MRLADYPRRSKNGDPVWELTALYPRQGQWTEADYLGLTSVETGIEFNCGRLEFLPMPTRTHQEILQLIWLALREFLAPRGDAWVSGLRVRTLKDRIRMPDVVALLDKSQGADELFERADIVVEVVSGSDSDRERDYTEKRAEYEQAGIPEYWIVDPAEGRITVLSLQNGKYIEYSRAEKGSKAESALLEGFVVDVTPLFERTR